jgi:hypothetical protein
LTLLPVRLTITDTLPAVNGIASTQILQMQTAGFMALMNMDTGARVLTPQKSHT